jgi:hypothetical protein
MSYGRLPFFNGYLLEAKKPQRADWGNLLSVKRPKPIIHLAAALALALIVKDTGKFLVINQPPHKAEMISF